MAMKESSKAVFTFLKETQTEDNTLSSIATALGMEPRSVNGCLVGMQKKGLVIREEVQSLDDAGKATTIKYIRLTPAADSFDPDAEAPKTVKASK